MKKLLPVLLLLCLSLTITATSTAASDRINLPKLFANEIDLLHEASRAPIYLPETMPKLANRNIPQLNGVTPTAWEMLLGAVPDCNRASACHLAGFKAKMDGKFSRANRQIVRLKGSINGRYAPSVCGASCSPASIQWRIGRTLYTIDAKVSSPKQTLTSMANSAIARGNR